MNETFAMKINSFKQTEFFPSLRFVFLKKITTSSKMRIATKILIVGHAPVKIGNIIILLNVGVLTTHTTNRLETHTHTY